MLERNHFSIQISYRKGHVNLKPINLTPITKKVEVHFTHNVVQLSSKRKREIEAFWEEVNRDGSFHRGEAFHVDAVTEDEDAFRFLLKQTDYAHYLHTVRNHMKDEEGCRIVFGAGLAETQDAVFVFGEMADHTAYPGRLQCAGGGLSREDLNGNYFDMERSVLREMQEELGVAPHHVERCTPVYVKSGGTYDFFSILFHVKLNILQSELKEIYKKFAETLVSKGEQPEFKDVIFLENNKKAIHNFIENDLRPFEDNLKPFLQKMAECT